VADTDIYEHAFDSEFGVIRTAATETALVLIWLPSGDEPGFRREVRHRLGRVRLVSGGPINLTAEKQIREYLRGARKAFDLPLDIRATEFHRAVLAEVARIPYGTTRTYARIAEAIGNPGASRAVGTANARNPLPLVIPCHRVVAATGPGNYGGGRAMKVRLLQLEGALNLLV